MNIIPISLRTRIPTTRLTHAVDIKYSIVDVLLLSSETIVDCDSIELLQLTIVENPTPMLSTVSWRVHIVLSSPLSP